MNGYRSGILAVLVLLIASCRQEVKLPAGFESEVEKIRMNYVPDNRTKVFNVVYRREGNYWRISAETTDPAAYAALTSVIPKYFDSTEVRADLQMLPHPDLKDSVWALVTLSVGNLKKLPDHAAELVDQVLMGSVVKILKQQRGWYLVQTPHDYLGWITRGSLYRTDLGGVENWEGQARIQMDEYYTMVYSAPSRESQVVCDMVQGCVVVRRGQQGSWWQIGIPDGRKGFVEARYFKPYQVPDSVRTISRDKIIARAMKLLGIPYVWGGNSIKGLDCSGFSSTVFAGEGYRLPRDANMQVLTGTEIFPDSSFSNVFAGDLLFFGSDKKISHVAISLGGYRFIHSAASSYVRINSLDAGDSLYAEADKKRLRTIKRIIEN
jgi:gamma-D-glutamyl-L-lysine dipeptidyl-peptidase